MKHSNAVVALLSLTLIFSLMISGDLMASGVQSSAKIPPVTEAEILAAQQFGQTLSIAEWLGPMAPVALSPFFGITCLSGMSLFGGGWISQGNPMIGENSPLHNPAVFWTFLSLTLLTSVPRLTKVSKPFAQAVDQMEAWSGIITMLVLKVMVAPDDAADAAAPVVQLGLISVSTDLLLMIAAAINIFVINTVKFFFEVLIWLTPMPFLDALFEVCNKAACAALMALYAWSPTVATALNAAIFLAAIIVFSWVYRREIFFRTMLFDAARSFWSRASPQLSLTVFPSTDIGRIRTRSKCTLQCLPEGWVLICEPWFRRAIREEFSGRNRPVIEQGLMSNTLRMTEPAVELTFSRRFNHALPELATLMKASLFTECRSTAKNKAEFA